MHKNWPNMADELNPLVAALRLGAPDVMRGFSQMAQAAIKDGALDARTKELIALAVSVAVRCDACIAFHTKAALRHGATREQVLEAMGTAVYMGAGPSAMYAAQAVEAFDQYALAAERA